MIKFRKVTESDEQLNSQIEALNRKVFPSTETTANLHFLAGLYKGATVDFIAVEDDDVFVGYTYVINFFQGSFIYYLAIEPEYQSKGYGTALLKHLREIQGNRPIALTIFPPEPDNDDYEDCLRRNPTEEFHQYDVYMSGFGIGYIELMAMLYKVDMFINSLIKYGR